MTIINCAPKTIQGRQVAFTALFGSHNYNLNDEDSDIDWKHFTLPTFDDLYTGKFFSTSKVGAVEDYDSHDIRRMSELFWKANINFLEVLYTDWMYINHPGIKPIIDMRDSIVTMNLPYLYSACHGMHCEKMKKLKQCTAGTQHLLDKFGYDTKQASHAYRVLDFIIRFHAYGWNFKKALTYTDAEKHTILDIKRGVFTEAEFREGIAPLYAQFRALEWMVYKAVEPNFDTKDKLDRIIKELIHSHICGVSMPCEGTR